MNLLAIIEAIQALEQLVPAVTSFVNKIHPPTTDQPTRADAALTMTNNALQAAEIGAETIQALQPTIQSAFHAALPVAASAAQVNVPAPIGQAPLATFVATITKGASLQDQASPVPN